MDIGQEETSDVTFELPGPGAQVLMDTANRLGHRHRHGDLSELALG
ncbi:MAG: hypothetical protein ACLRSY_09015 [Acutalibacter sp.]